MKFFIFEITQMKKMRKKLLAKEFFHLFIVNKLIINININIHI